MRRTLLALVLLCMLLAGGCVSVPLFDSFTKEQPTPIVPSNPFAPPSPVTKPVKAYSYTPASADLGMRVDAIGRKVLQANPQSGLSPTKMLFATYGSAKPEIFHQGTKMVNITDGLVKQCQTEGQLAAVLALELAKMVAERESLANPRTRSPQRSLPMDVPIGNAGQGGIPDLTRLPELARYDKIRQEDDRPQPALDPKVLAGVYLEKAGYSRTDLDAAQPLLKVADGNADLQKHLKNYNVGQWVPTKSP